MMKYIDCVYVDENTDEDVPVKAVYDSERQQVTVFDTNNQVVMLPGEVFDNKSEPAIFDNISEENWKEFVEEAKRFNNGISIFYLDNIKPPEPKTQGFFFHPFRQNLHCILGDSVYTH